MNEDWNVPQGCFRGFNGKGRNMVTYNVILEIGRRLRNTSNGYITHAQLRRLLMTATNTHHDKTIIHYMKVLQSEGFIKATNHDGCPMFRIIRGEK